MTGPGGTPGPPGGDRRESPPGAPPADLTDAVARHPDRLAACHAPDGGWRLSVSAWPLLAGHLDSADGEELARFAWAFDAMLRAAAHKCECGHSRSGHDIETKTQRCCRIGCGCVGFTLRGDIVIAGRGGSG